MILLQDTGLRDPPPPPDLTRPGRKNCVPPRPCTLSGKTRFAPLPQPTPVPPRTKQEKQFFKKKLITVMKKTDLKSEYSMLIDQILLKIDA